MKSLLKERKGVETLKVRKGVSMKQIEAEQAGKDMEQFKLAKEAISHSNASICFELSARSLKRRVDQYTDTYVVL